MNEDSRSVKSVTSQSQMTNDNLRMRSRGFRVTNSGLELLSQSAAGARPDGDFVTMRELRLKLEHCQDEILKLQSVITELTQVNKRWQKYNNDRQVYVQKLLDTIQDQQEQLNFIGQRSYSSSSEQSTSSMPQEISSDPEIERLRDTERRLNERVSVLEFQVKAHRDDWEAEVCEKKKALKDKESAESRVAELMRALALSGSCESGYVDEKTELYCQNCGQVSEFDQFPPSRSKIYRSAVHLPCSSSRHSSTTSISTSDELVIDSGTVPKQDRLQLDGGKATASWNIKPEETSYSRSSTIPLDCGPVQSLPSSAAVTTNSSASSISERTCKVNCNPVTVKSIAKSSSVPEGRSCKFSDLSSMSLDCFEFSSEAPPVSIVHSSEQYGGTITNSAENVICLRCGEIFPPNKHLMFLDHFPNCQSNRSFKLGSRDGAPKASQNGKTV